MEDFFQVLFIFLGFLCFMLFSAYEYNILSEKWQPDSRVRSFLERNKSVLQELGSSVLMGQEHPFKTKQDFMVITGKMASQLQGPKGKPAKPLRSSKGCHHLTPAVGFSGQI